MVRKTKGHSAFTQKYLEILHVTTLNCVQMKSAIVKLGKNAYVTMEPANENRTEEDNLLGNFFIYHSDSHVFISCD